MDWAWKPLIDPDEVRRELFEINADSISAFAARIKTDSAFRTEIVAGYGDWTRYFKGCAENVIYFRTDPSLIERFLIALSIDAETVGRDVFPPLYAAIEEIRGIAERTADVRRAIAAENVDAAFRQKQERPLA